MTRDEALIRAALDMAADMIEESAKDAMDAADTSDIGSIIATWLNDEADAIRAIDPAEVLQTASMWKGPGETPHRYSPDYMAQGDCQVCGHTREAHQSSPDAVARLVEAAQALGAMPEGYCFCSANRVGDDRKIHEPECADLRAALAAMEASHDRT